MPLAFSCCVYLTSLSFQATPPVNPGLPFSDFYAHYGERGKGFIEIHHQKPVFQYDDGDMNQFIDKALQNVVPVCSNCHRMIHREKNAPMPIEELKQLVDKCRESVM